MQKRTAFALLLMSIFALFGFAVSLAAGSATAAAEEEPLLCRFGVNYTSDLPGDSLANYDLTLIRSGWYIDYGARHQSLGPPAADYGRMVRLWEEPEDNTSGFYPSASSIQSVAAANPGGMWFIGNEPDRIKWQDDVRPAVYARLYHEVYHLLKDADPSARIFAGSIVQATPLRIRYLDLVLDSYQAQFGTAMPVDGWSIHGFVLNEVACDWDRSRCWGAEIPPGVDANHGEILQVDDSDNIHLYTERVERFRRWMRDRGYRDKPLSMSEFGILMPEDYVGTGRVNAFMNATFDYMSTATDPKLGYPRDGNRLVQNWSWFAVADVRSLYDFNTKALTAIGQNYAAYTTDIDTVDFHSFQLLTEPAAPFSPVEPVTLTLRALVANSGDLVTPSEPVAVRIYDGDPAQGANQIGTTQTVSLAGCGEYATVSVTWPNVPPGAHVVYVSIEPATGEDNTANNVTPHTVLVGTDRAFLPVVRR